jgi:tripartite-type tricarboxylate transporter receptor subunit TctC
VIQIQKRLLLLLGAGLFMAGGGLAQNYPDRPIRLIVPFPAPGPADSIARALGEQLSRRLGQPVVVDNKPGAGGNLGTALAARAPADGYTVFIGAGATLSVNPALSKSPLPYDALKDFAPIAPLATAPNLLLVNPSRVPASNVAELVALARKANAPMIFASGGRGSSGHLSAEMLRHAAGVQLQHVAYKGQSQAITDLIGGHVGVMFVAVSAGREQVAAGKVRALAITSARRSNLAPELPTVAEAGFPGFEAVAWWGLLAPAGTPAAIVSRLNEEVNHILQSPEMKATMARQGAEPFTLNVPQFQAFVRDDVARSAKLVEAAGIEKE